MTTLTVWGRANSINVQKVLWLLAELDVPYRHIPAGGAHGGLDTPEFLAMNPCGRVPVIQDGDVVVWESHAILRYLAATRGRERFWSEDAAERSMDDRWMDWSETSLQPDFINGIFWGFYRTPEPLRDAQAIAAKVASCAAHMQLLDKILKSQPFLSGGALGLADIPAGALLFRYFNLEIDRPHVPHVASWYARLQERQAYRDHVMLPFDNLKAR